MSRIEACRICLITDVKLERIQGPLERNIKNVFGCNIQYSPDLPDYACYECTALIMKYSKFRKKYFTAQSMLFNILQNHGMVTEKEIKNLDRNACKLSSNLSVIQTDNYTSLSPPEVKIEWDPMRGIPELTIDSDEEHRLDNTSDDDSDNLVEYVNRKKQKSGISPEKQKKSIASSNNWGDRSNKKKRMGNCSRKENMTRHFKDTTLANGAKANSTYFLEENSDMELNDSDNDTEEHSLAYYEAQSSSDTKKTTAQILENQNKMMSKLASMSAQLKTIAKQYNNNTTLTTYDVSSTSSSKVSSPIIENKKQLDDFENELNDPEKKKTLLSKYSIFFKGRGQAITCAYILMDALFSRKFLTKCSWAGGSRGEEGKIAFKSYKNILIFLYEVIQECDSNFSLLDCYSFVKTILKNSIKRCQSKGLRMSAKRRRRITPEITAFEIDLENVLTNNPEALEEET